MKPIQSGTISITKGITILIALLVLIIIVSLCSLATGAIHIPPSVLIKWLSGMADDSVHLQIIQEVRLPLILRIIAVGMGVGASAVLLQKNMRHPLPDPGILGLTAGGTIGMYAALLVAPDRPLIVYLIASCLGAAALGGLVLGLAKWIRIVRGSLAVRSMAVGAVMTVVFYVCVQLLPWSEQDSELGLLKSIYFRSSDSSWEMLNTVLPWLLAGVIGALILTLVRPASDAGRKGAAIAAVILMVQLSAGIAAAFGAIVMVGALVAQLARRLAGGDDRWTMPYAAILGAVVLALLDMVNRKIISPFELPWHVLVYAIGVPVTVVVYYLHNKKRMVD